MQPDKGKIQEFCKRCQRCCCRSFCRVSPGKIKRWNLSISFELSNDRPLLSWIGLSKWKLKQTSPPSHKWRHSIKRLGCYSFQWTCFLFCLVAGSFERTGASLKLARTTQRLWWKTSQGSSTTAEPKAWGLTFFLTLLFGFRKLE